MFWTIVKHHNELHYSEVPIKFAAVTGHQVKTYFEYQPKDIETYLRLKPNMFSVNKKGIVTTKEYDEAKEFGHLLCPSKNKWVDKNAISNPENAEAPKKPANVEPVIIDLD